MRTGCGVDPQHGQQPGFITEAVALVLTSIQRRLDGLTIDEFARLSQRNSPGLLFDVMGFGKPPAAVDQRRLSHGRIAFGPSLQLVAEALSVHGRRPRFERPRSKLSSRS
jgi:2,4-diaminopentanoate dehydrogenase